MTRILGVSAVPGFFPPGPVDWSNGQTLVPAEDLEQAQARIAELEVALRRKRLIFDQVCNDRAALNADVNRLSADRLESEATADDVVEKAEQFTAEQVRDAIIEVLDQNAVSLWLPYGDTPHGTVHPEDVGHVARWVVAKLRGSHDRSRRRRSTEGV
ncbi:hypothetical protein [Gordonia westfalica]|uniref:Uncharacterized protein n=1 Tax=Gordonia westfalica TaxID=158898 RepID=A0A1H2DNV1_9ACTN|nr:hypothetical protein [Gordonia westfalica]SDT84519.1 hypothetical protein SAMN04488548_10938 [Gordonia westfalica]